MTNDSELRKAGVRALEKKGYAVTSIAKGQGVPSFSRVKIEKEGKKETCAIKTSAGGRISFTRNSDGSYKVLSEVDYVLHVKPDAQEPSKAHMTLFDRATVVAAFDVNFKALAAQKYGTHSNMDKSGNGTWLEAGWVGLH